MRKLSFALVVAAALLGSSSFANAAPVGLTDLKPMAAQAGTQVDQVHWRRWRHCHRVCRWRHHHRRCWRYCHGGRRRW